MISRKVLCRQWMRSSLAHALSLTQSTGYLLQCRIHHKHAGALDVRCMFCKSGAHQLHCGLTKYISFTELEWSTCAATCITHHAFFGQVCKLSTLYLCICGVLKGIKDLLKGDGLTCLLVYCLPNNTVCLRVQLESNTLHGDCLLPTFR